MWTLRIADAGQGDMRPRRSSALVAVVVALVAGGCQLLWWGAQTNPAPVTPLGEIVQVGSVEVPGSGFAITIPDDWMAEVAPGPGIESAPSGAAWEALRAYTPERSETCSIYVALPPEGVLGDDGDVGIGSGSSVQKPYLIVGVGAPTIMVPAPRIESAATQRHSTMTTQTRLAASDPGTRRDVLYGLVCGADRERDFDPILGTFRYVPVPAASMAPTMSIVARPISNVTLGIYSGRPDPSWVLAEAESTELGHLLGSLPSAVGDTPQGGLGYHGFVLTPADAGQADRALVAYRGAISGLGSGSRTYLVDVDRTVERFLLETGRHHLSVGEVDAVETDLTLARGD